MSTSTPNTPASNLEALSPASKTARATASIPGALREQSAGTTAPQPTISPLNFDDIRRNTIPVTKHGTRYDLYDDIPTEIIMAVFSLIGFEARIKEASTAAESIYSGAAMGSIAEATEDMGAAFADLRDESVRICADIFRHSYPDMSDDELANLLNYDERMAVIKHFFTHRLIALNEQQNATSSDEDQALRQAAAQYQASQAQQEGNRATRRQSRPAPIPRPRR